MLNGKKTYLASIATGLTGLLALFVPFDEQTLNAVQTLLGAILAATLRNAVGNK
jgi:hypothetical protein